MSERDDGRVSTIHERPQVSDARFLAMCRALAPMQAYDAGRRSVATGNDGRGGVPEMTATERASDAGDLRRASAAYAHLCRVPLGPAHAALAWLRTYAHGGDLASLAALYGSHAAPMDLREAAQNAAMRAAGAARALAVAQSELSAAAPRGARRPTPQADSLRALVAVRIEQRDALDGRVLATTAALTAWGVAALSAAVEAWERADDRRDEAA